MAFRKIILCFVLISVFLSSCKKAKEADTPQHGTITLVADSTFANVTGALTERYMALYPEAKIIVKYKKENEGFLDLLDDKAQVAVMSKTLSSDEKEAYKQKVDMKLEPANFALDGAVFVVPKDSELDSLSVEEIRNKLVNGHQDFIFDSSNGANFSLVTQKLKLNRDQISYGTIKGGDVKIIEELSKYPGKIGVVSYNTLSREHFPLTQKLKEMVKVLKISQNNGKAYEPNLVTMRYFEYPFSRVLYFITNEGFFGVGNGLIRFSCTQLGQIVVAHDGLQPYNIYKREVQMR
ncbi:PstS family phosphate ABC transporter substrate-binding protein [Riemerella columbipharyngis]|uniref:Phosphate transport system substrate-binding protein n=1 Tax=Riemerella columbipharyngis TaxID=1071918 RepID=A0A1G7ET41_9FLAO|nr:substrate-binding domain-containing protein [Riemerella columbipharyngis]SDE66853.1 phosphate transport system substrate-binding protein [Riemerella columbipharyngis]